MSTASKSVSLVLGSGGARGLAHIGVIQWLTEHGYQIRSIAGSSMGALVNPLPVAPTLHDRTDLTIAVNLGAPAEPRPAPPHARPRAGGSAACSTSPGSRCRRCTTPWRG